ncbi:hypothetical protein EDC04DRAFT_2905096 [Pisolithus marmoratus]|nr:hypothetical protein EDC04DRAFT_2905096 [Pisolithus marmoratus]
MSEDQKMRACMRELEVNDTREVKSSKARKEGKSGQGDNLNHTIASSLDSRKRQLGQTQGNGVTLSKAPVAPVNSTTTSPLLANSTKTGQPRRCRRRACEAQGACRALRNPPGGTQTAPSTSGKEGFSDEQSGPVSDDPEKLKKRAERFGSTNTPTQTVKSGSKRAAPVEEVDAEELERRRKRAERFGTLDLPDGWALFPLIRIDCQRCVL